jgi:hypothetical protein
MIRYVVAEDLFGNLLIQQNNFTTQKIKNTTNE